jgi:hypothetical protein
MFPPDQRLQATLAWPGRSRLQPLVAVGSLSTENPHVTLSRDLPIRLLLTPIWTLF